MEIIEKNVTKKIKEVKLADYHFVEGQYCDIGIDRVYIIELYTGDNLKQILQKTGDFRDVNKNKYSNDSAVLGVSLSINGDMFTTYFTENGTEIF